MQLTDRTLPIAYVLRYARRALPVRGWERIFRFAFNPDVQCSFPFRLLVPGGKIYADAASYYDWFALFYGSIEPDDLNMTIRVLSRIRAAIALDVGANVGHYALAMAMHAKTVHAFEPDDDCYRRLTQNIEAARANVITYHCGLSDRDEHLSFIPPSDNNRGNGRFCSNGPVSHQVWHGDRFLAGRGVLSVDFIKIDVEGMEKQVLDGLKSTIERCRPIVLCEVSNGTAQLSRLLPKGYYLFRNEPNRVISHSHLRPLRSSISAWAGNIFCVPEERVGLLT